MNETLSGKPGAVHEAKDNASPLAYIRNVFIEMLGDGGEENFTRALQIQNLPEFAAGRQKGADELGNWLKSQGRISVLGLANHFRS